MVLQGVVNGLGSVNIGLCNGNTSEVGTEE